MSRRESNSSVVNANTPRPVRCAIYTRKSSEDGLEQEFNSLDAQREAAEAYVASQKGSGWVALPERYDDGGYSGGNTERPALQRLLKDIELGKVDLVLVYKLDRLSRSLLDFAGLMEAFERRSVSFVSITQRFSTADSMGRLMMNVLLSFAQFEREIIGERIRDKLAALRRKGKWAGGAPVLGYDVDRSGNSPKLVVNGLEASRVRRIFELYLEFGSLLPVVHRLKEMGWTNKATTTSTGRIRGGMPFDRAKLHSLLTNPIYRGMVRHRGALHPGEHEAIVPDDIFAKVQAQLQQHGRGHGGHLRNKHGALLRGLLYCKACQKSMTHIFSGRGNRLYRYYTCTAAIKNGHATCPTKSLPAAEVEKAIVEQVRVIANDPALLKETLARAKAVSEERRAALTGERAGLQRALTKVQTEVRQLATRPASRSAIESAVRLSDLHERARTTEARVREIDEEVGELNAAQVHGHELTATFRGFDGMWSHLSPKEQAELLRTLIQRIEFDAGASDLSIAFHDCAIGSLARPRKEEAA